MVYNVALRVTHDAHDAEDATQATFLTLAVHAKTSGKIRFLGPWLKKVSHRLALDIRRSKKRRTAREQRHAASNGAESNGNGNGHDLPIASGLHTEELRHILRDEIDRLPAKYRMPLILYYFGGLTPEEIGGQLHCNTSTLGVRLHRGRKMLAESLSTRGITMSRGDCRGTVLERAGRYASSKITSSTPPPAPVQRNGQRKRLSTAHASSTGMCCTSCGSPTSALRNGRAESCRRGRSPDGQHARRRPQRRSIQANRSGQFNTLLQQLQPDASDSAAAGSTARSAGDFTGHSRCK